MNSVINENILDKPNDSLIEKISDFQEKQLKSIVGSTNNNLLQSLKMWANAIQHVVKLSMKWPAYLYEKFSKEYEDIKPIAKELSKELPNLDWERERDEKLIDQFGDASETDKNEYREAIKKWYDMLEREIIPVETRLQQLEDIIKKIKELAYGDKDPKSFIFSLDFSLIRDEEEKMLAYAFREKHTDIIIAMKTYTTVKRIIKELKEKMIRIEKKPENKNNQ